MRYQPELCVWETTLACNLSCRHCGSSAGKPRDNELDTSEALGLLQALAELGTAELTLSGGELFVRPDWRQLLGRARELGLSCLVVSNGLAITREVAQELGRQKVGSVSLSVDGGARVHDWLRPPNRLLGSELSGPVGMQGVSSHEQLHFAIDNLRAAELPVAAITQVSRTNLHELPAIADFLVSHAIEAWQIQLTAPMGRSARQGGAERVAVLEPEDLPSLYAFIRRVQDEGRLRCLAADCIGYFGSDEPLLRRFERPNDSFWQGCQGGMRVVGITSDGGVKGCLSMPDAFLEGNIRERPLAAIWRDESAFAYNRKFEVDSLSAGCSGCAFGKLCRAGCHSFAATAQGGDISRYDYCIRLRAPEPGASRR